MVRTRAMISRTSGLFSLGDDALRGALAFASVGDGARASATSRALRALATSGALARARGAEEYALRSRGVVHALATAFGRRRWPTAVMPVRAPPLWPVRTPRLPPQAVVPQPLQVAVHREGQAVFSPDGDAVRLEEERWSAVSQPMDPRVHSSVLCTVGDGAFLEYELPFHLRVDRFQLGFGACMAREFADWTLEGFDGQGEWQVAFDSGGQAPWSGAAIMHSGAVQTFRLDAPFEASRFRLRVGRDTNQCFHPRAFELFGTVLPPWRPL